MPTTYAHYKFGNEVSQMLPEEYQQVIEVERDLFDWGVHGPDLLFYYRIWKNNPVTARGTRIHKAPAVAFMKRAAKCFRGQIADADFQMKSQAFLYGFLCHFALDRACHGYINAMAAQKLASHYRIESEFDRHLLMIDGKDPLKEDLSGHLHPSLENARLIMEYFGFSEEVILESMVSMVKAVDLLQARGPVTRGVVTTSLDLLHKTNKLDMVMPLEESETIYPMSTLLETLFEEAKEDAVSMIFEFDTLAKSGEWDDKYYYNFSGKHMKKA